MSTAQPAIGPSPAANGADQPVFPFASFWQPVPNSRERVLFVLAFAVLTAMRCPTAFWHGRFWAEEGSLYANAWSLPWWQVLLFSNAGYLNFVANFAGPAILVVFAPDAWLQKRALVIWMLFVDVHDYFWPSASTIASGPDWTLQVARWERGSYLSAEDLAARMDHALAGPGVLALTALWSRP